MGRNTRNPNPSFTTNLGAYSMNLEQAREQVLDGWEQVQESEINETYWSQDGQDRLQLQQDRVTITQWNARFWTYRNRSE